MILARRARPPFALATLALALCVGAPSRSHARPTKAAPSDGLPSVEDVAPKAREVYADLAGNSDPLVRAALFDGQLELGGEDRVGAITTALADADAGLRGRALELALTDGDKALKPLKKPAEEALVKLLESADEAERTLGYRVLDAYATKKKDWLTRVEVAARDGSPAARAAARGKLIAEGGATAWKVIEAGLAEAPSEPEHVAAVAALDSFSDASAIKWARGAMHDDGATGVLARGLLTRITDPKASKALMKELDKTYEKSADFEERLRIAVVLAGRGEVDHVARTLLAALKYQKAWARTVAFEGLRFSRDLVTLGKLRELILTNQDEAQADGAYAWLEAWARQKAEPQVYEILQEAARSDRRPLRMRAMGVLTAVKHRPSVALFEASMSEGQVEVRLAAAKGLAAVARSGDEAHLADFLRREPDVQVKRALIGALAAIGTPDILDSLQFVITARDKDLKMAAAKAVAGTGTAKAATLLGLLKGDPDLDVRFLALHNLLQLAPKETLTTFKNALTWLSPDQIEALGLDLKVPVEAMQIAAEQGDDLQRTFAVAALQARGDDKAAVRLLDLYEKSPHADTSATALAALAKVRQEKSVPTYRDAIKSPQGEVRAAAYRAIAQYGPRALLETVLQGLADKEPRARVEAARAALALAARDV